MSKILDPHPDFRLNGNSFGLKELRLHADVLTKSPDSFQKELGLFLSEWLSDSQTIVLKTSGSTGKPKKITALKSQFLASARATTQFLDLKPKQSALLCLPLQYIGGKMMLIRAMVAGLWIDVVTPVSSPFSEIDHYDFSAITPYQLQHSLDYLEKIGQLLVGGAPIPSTTAALLKGHRCSVFETYGMTETFSHVALKNISSGDSVFRALPNISFSIHRDCLRIHAPHLSKTPFQTRDLVTLKSETTFVWLGRADHVINSGGVKLHPEQIEKQLSHLFKTSSVVFGLPDAALGESLAVVFEGELPSRAIQKMKETDLLDRYEKPKKIFSLLEFVRKNDKIMRKETLALLRKTGLQSV